MAAVATPYMHADITSNTAEPSPLPSFPPSSCAWRQAARTELTTRDLPHNPRRGPGPVVRKSSVLSPSPLLTDALSLQDRRAADRHVEQRPAPKYRVPLAPQWPMEPLLSLFISACMPRLRLNSTRTTPPNRCCSSRLREPSRFALQTCSLCMKKKKKKDRMAACKGHAADKTPSLVFFASVVHADVQLLRYWTRLLPHRDMIMPKAVYRASTASLADTTPRLNVLSPPLHALRPIPSCRVPEAFAYRPDPHVAQPSSSAQSHQNQHHTLLIPDQSRLILACQIPSSNPTFWNMDT